MLPVSYMVLDCLANIRYETDIKVEDIKALSSFSYDNKDIGAAPASGSLKDGQAPEVKRNRAQVR